MGVPVVAGPVEAPPPEMMVRRAMARDSPAGYAGGAAELPDGVPAPAEDGDKLTSGRELMHVLAR
jgi:hypothetical protein